MKLANVLIILSALIFGVSNCLSSGKISKIDRFRHFAEVSHTASIAVQSRTRSVGLSKTLSSGTWTEQSSGTNLTLWSVSIVDDQVAWAVGDSGIALRTTDGGTNWLAVTRLPDFCFSVCALSKDTVLAPVFGNMYRTSDGGISWALVYNNSDPAAFMDDIFMFDTNNGFAVGDPVTGSWVLLRTSDGGSTWSPSGALSQNGGEAGYPNSMAWSGTQNGWFGTDNSRIYRTTNGGGSWTASSTKSVNDYTVAFNDANTGLSGDSLVNLTTDGGAIWDSVYSHEIIPGNDEFVHLAGTTTGGERWWKTNGTNEVQVSTNRGTSWQTDYTHSNPSVGFNHLKIRENNSSNGLFGYAVGTFGSISKYAETLGPPDNHLTVRSYDDEDGAMATAGDRTLKNWHLEIRQGSAGGAVIASGDGDSVSATGLPNGTYYAVEADSNGWLHLGYLTDGVPVEADSNNVGVALSNNHHVVLDFVNVPPSSQKYRTATSLEWATAEDMKGNLKSLKRKADKVDFKRNIVAPADADGFTLKLNVESRGKLFFTEAKDDTLIPDAPWDSVKEVHYTEAVSANDSFQIEGRGFKGKPFEVSVVWETAGRATTVKYKKNSPGWKKNLLGLPMPNLHNVGEELFPKGFGQQISYYSPSNPLVVGTLKGGDNPNSVRHQEYKDVQKSLIKRTKNGDVLHNMPARCLNFFDTNGSPNSSKPITKQPKSLPPDKHNNKLFAEVLTLKLNVAASVTGKFPSGLGQLTYDDQSDPGGLLNGQLVDSIVVKADRVLACFIDTTKGDTLTPEDMYDVVRKINCAFADSPYTVDTNSFAAKTNLTGIKRLADVPYLHFTPGILSATFIPSTKNQWTMPSGYALRQNYPNPFNPSTMIRFQLPEPATVTLKIYSLLGQEVATLVNNESMDEGIQEIEFNGGNVASGIYFYRLEAHGIPNENGIGGQKFTSVRKMMLLK